jgi:hypothetical protein
MTGGTPMTDRLAPRVAPVPRVALTREEAAASLGIGLTTFKQRVQPHLRLVRIGTVVMVPLTELQRFLDNHAERLIEAG